jgi:signal transduction histidine kinase
MGLAQEFLNFSSSQQCILNLQTCSVKDLIEDILVSIERDFVRRDITIYTDLHYLGQLWVDVRKMKRVFMNIIDNARDAMPDGGTLRITSRLVGNRIQLDIADTGHGIPPKLQAHIFEPCVTEGKQHGTGLGLAIVKDILDQHHAHIDIQSALGEGTTVRISLPQNT